MQTCRYLSRCEFVLKYIPKVRPLWDEFVTLYCQGDFQDVCCRKKWFVEKGEVPPPELMPSGMQVPDLVAKGDSAT